MDFTDTPWLNVLVPGTTRLISLSLKFVIFHQVISIFVQGKKILMVKHINRSSLIVHLNSVFNGTEVILVILQLFQGSHFLLGEFSHFNVKKKKKNHLKTLWEMQPVQTILNCLKQMRERGIKLGSFFQMLQKYLLYTVFYLQKYSYTLSLVEK